MVFAFLNCSNLPNFNHRLTCFCRFVSLLSRFAFFSPFCFIQFSRYIWWAQVGSNHRPLAYQASALACWAMSPFSVLPNWFSHPWWRWRDSNSWPPACRAGALPTELHPRSFFQLFRVFGPWKSNNDWLNAEPLILVFVSQSFLWDGLFSCFSDRICHARSLSVMILHRKEVIQPHLPIRLPCYDLTPIIEPTLGGCLLAVSPPALGVFNFHGLTGGVYKARERIHRGMLTRDY